MEQHQKRFGDRRDAYLIRDLDGMHFIMNIIYGKRTENEAYVSVPVDLTQIQEYVAGKNYEGIDFKYTMFHILVAAVLKTIYLRPKLNRYISCENMYQRYKVSASFMVKKKFNDTSEEGIAFIYADDNDTVDTVHEKIKKVVIRERREGSANSTDEFMDIFAHKLPKPVSKGLTHAVMALEHHGLAPQEMIADDPTQASALISNLGSIHLKSGYHHLSNWGTNSVFVMIGEKEKRPVYHEDGTYELRDFLDLGLTIDERLADGYYFSRSIHLLKYLCEHPAELEKPLCEEVSYD